MAWGKVKTEPAWLVTLEFIMENMGVIVTGDGPLIMVAVASICALFPRVLRSRTFLLMLPPSEVGAIVGIVGESRGRETASMIGLLLPSVLKSRTSAALAVKATLARRTATIRINFIHEPPFSKGYSIRPLFQVREL